MALVPILGLLSVILNLVVSRFFSQAQEAISSVYLVISYVNVLVGIVALLHTGAFNQSHLMINFITNHYQERFILRVNILIY